MAERTYSVSEARDDGQKELCCEARGGGQEEPPRIQGQGRRPRGATLRLRPGVAPEARGSGREEPHDIQGVVAVWAQEGLVEPSHVEGQEGWR